MTTTATLLVLLAVLVVAAIGVAIAFYARHDRVRRRFGPEYDRVAAEKENMFAADRELRERERRHAKLELKELDPATRDWYSENWQHVQARFVESPQSAIGEADELVTRLIGERGYPIEDYDEQLHLLSVEHARVIDDYRVAHDIAEQHTRGRADTEMLRQALMHYRALVADLLGTDAGLRSDALAEGAHPNEATVPGLGGDPRAMHHRDAKADAAATYAPAAAGRPGTDLPPEDSAEARHRNAQAMPTPGDGGATRTDREDADADERDADRTERLTGTAEERAAAARGDDTVAASPAERQRVRGTAKVPQGKATVQSGRQPAGTEDQANTRPRRP